MNFVKVEARTTNNSPIFNLELPKVPKLTYLYEGVVDSVHFIARFCKNPTTVGSIIPSSPFLAEKMVKYIPSRDVKEESKKTKIYYLEVGPGTGVVTDKLVKAAEKEATIDIIELDKVFCQLLIKRFADKKNVHIHNIAIEHWKPKYKYDAIVSGLPLNSFSPEQVSNFLQIFKKLAKPEATVHYFEYIGLPDLKKRFLSKSERETFEKTLEIKQKFFDIYGYATDVVPLNVTPARVLHHRMKD